MERIGLRAQTPRFRTATTQPNSSAARIARCSAISFCSFTLAAPGDTVRNYIAMGGDASG